MPVLIEIELTKGMVAFIDDADFTLVGKYKWFASYHGNGGCHKYYALTFNKELGTPHVRMHRLIMGLKRGDKRVVHHKDDNCLNNCRDNLEILATNSHNMRKSTKWGNKKR